MKEYRRENVRNIAIIAHHGAGKTSLAEAMLYLGGATEKLGKTSDNTSVLDFEHEEQNRKMSTNTHVGFCEWNGHLFNIVDTPGFSNFLYETVSALRVVDSAIVIVSGITGVKAQTEKFWELASSLSLPRLLYMNKLDRERANFGNAIADIEKDLGVKPTPLFLPIGEEENFSGVVDLLRMEAYLYEGGKRKAVPIPEALHDEVVEWRERLVESVAETDDVLLEKYLNGETIDNEALTLGIRNGVLTSKIVPVVVGSATKLYGVDTLLDSVVSYLPSPLDRPGVTMIDPRGESIIRKPDEKAPLSALVFKTISDPYAGKISILRMFSGTIRPDSYVYNSTKGVKEKIGHLSKLIGKKQYPVPQALAGDIVAAVKLKETLTGDTLCEDGGFLRIPYVDMPNPVISYAIEPKTRTDEDKLMGSLVKIKEEDPTIQFKRDEQTNEFLISGSGQVHIEVVVEKLKSTYGVNVDLKTPKVPYKETIKATAKAEGKYIKQTGGRGQYGDVWLQIEPLPRGEGFVFVDRIVGGVIPKNFIPSVEKGVREAMQKGVLASYPVTDVKVTLFDGKHHPVDSSDIAFQIAGSMGFKKAMEAAKPVLLEPVMKMEIVVPEDSLGEVIGDINARRGKVLGVEPQAGGHVIRAIVPMSEVLSYAPELRSITSGRGIFTMEFSHYDEVPSHQASKIIENAQLQKEGTEG
jgi:elongation factor G